MHIGISSGFFMSISVIMGKFRVFSNKTKIQDSCVTIDII